MKTIAIWFFAIIPCHLLAETNDGYYVHTFPSPDYILSKSPVSSRGNFVFDPDHLLSTRTALIVEKLLINSRLDIIDCSTRIKDNQCGNKLAEQARNDAPESALVVLADKVHAFNLSQCSGGQAEKSDWPIVQVEEMALNSMTEFGQNLLYEWNENRKSACKVDILLLFSNAVVLCDLGASVTLRNPSRQMLAIAVSNWLTIGSAQDVDLFKSSVKQIAQQVNHNTTLSTMSKRVEATLELIQPTLQTMRRARAQFMLFYSCPLRSLPSYKIPSWAVTTLCVSMALIVICTCIGYLANKHTSALRICDPNPFSLIDFKNRNRKWRAGFGGGLI